jgi:hypothetical protein
MAPKYFVELIAIPFPDRRDFLDCSNDEESSTSISWRRITKGFSNWTRYLRA